MENIHERVIVVLEELHPKLNVKKWYYQAPCQGYLLAMPTLLKTILNLCESVYANSMLDEKLLVTMIERFIEDDPNVFHEVSTDPLRFAIYACRWDVVNALMTFPQVDVSRYGQSSSSLMLAITADYTSFQNERDAGVINIAKKVTEEMLNALYRVPLATVPMEKTPLDPCFK